TGSRRRLEPLARGAGPRAERRLTSDRLGVLLALVFRVRAASLAEGDRPDSSRAVLCRPRGARLVVDPLARNYRAGDRGGRRRVVVGGSPLGRASHRTHWAGGRRGGDLADPHPRLPRTARRGDGFWRRAIDDDGRHVRRLAGRGYHLLCRPLRGDPLRGAATDPPAAAPLALRP